MKLRTNAFSVIAVLIAAILITGASCKQIQAAITTVDSTIVKHPQWSKNLSIYEINVRQFTHEGTFAALESHLPRLKELGTDILWIMPIHPIGMENRKGTLGSYYSVKDYKAVNPDFGTDADFKRFVQKAHELGMYVIIDWVANHSAWDNSLVKDHPDWYDQDSTGKLLSPFDWTDVVKFNYANHDMSNYMLEAMKYWVANFDIDGYRCDVAGMVPDTFWMNTRRELDKIKPVFMLAEGEKPAHHPAFDMTYGWEFHHIMNKIYKGEANANNIEKYLKKNDSAYAANDYRMYFITNHDENSWNGTEFERLGKGVEAFYVLTATVPGMPLVYSGQESGLNKRLQFFEKDPIEWGNYSMTPFYKAILGLKKANPALYNGAYGGSWKRIYTNADNKVFVILRKKDNNRVLSIVNLSDSPVTAELAGEEFADDYTELFGGKNITLKKGEKIELQAWGYQVFYK